MSSSSKKVPILLLILVPTLLMTAVTFYMAGLRMRGKPEEFREKHLERIQAFRDSVKAASLILPENAGDSTMVGMETHASIFEDNLEYENQIKTVRTALDSLQYTQKALEEKQKELERQQEFLDDLKSKALDTKITSLAKIYDNMKFKQAVPLVTAMDDTLAVLILSNMQQRNAAKLLGGVADTDVEKAKRLNELLAVLGTDF